MPSLQRYLIVPLLRIQKLGQRWATIESTRRAFQSSEQPGRALDGIRVEIVRVGDALYEWYIPDNAKPDRVLFYIHGGGYVFPLWNPLRRVMYHVAQAAQARVFAPHFRLAPEHPYPAAVEDCAAAYRWLISSGGVDPQHITFCGESAGAVLVLTTTLALRDAGDPLPAKLISISGSFDVAGAMERFKHVNDPMVHGPFALLHIRSYVGHADPHDPLISPAYATLNGLPPLYIQVGEDELDCEDARRFTAQAREAGVQVKLDVWPGMWHFWHVFVPFLPEARQAIAALAAFVATSS